MDRAPVTGRRSRTLPWLVLVAVALLGCGGGSPGPAPGTGLSVVAVVPSDLAVDVPVLGTVEVRFDVALDPTSVEPGTLTVDDGYGTVAGTVTYDETARRLRFVPEREYGHDAVVVVTIAPTLRSAEGVRYATGFRWSFVTVARVWRPLPDLGTSPRSTPPVIGVASDGAVAVGWEDRVSVLDEATRTWRHAALGDATTSGVQVRAVAWSESEAFVGWTARSTRGGAPDTVVVVSALGTSAPVGVELSRRQGVSVDDAFVCAVGPLGHLQVVAHTFNGVPSANRGTGWWSAPGPIGSRSWLERDLTTPPHDEAKVQIGIAADGGVTTLHASVGSGPSTLRYLEPWSGAAVSSPAEPGALITADDGMARILGVRDGAAELVTFRRGMAVAATLRTNLPTSAAPRAVHAAGCANGDLVAVIEGRLDDTHSVLFGLGYDTRQGTWVGPNVISASLPRGDAIQLRVVAGPRGDGWVTFRGTDAAGPVLVGRRYRPSRGFGAEQVLVRGDAVLGIGDSAIAIDAQGRTTVAWIDFGGAALVHAARLE